MGDTVASERMIAAYYPPIAHGSAQTVIECGGELASLVLWGRREGGAPWEFQTVMTDWSACDLYADGHAGQGPRRLESDWVSSWAAAVQLLGSSWELLVPGTVHAEFRSATLTEVTRRLSGERRDDTKEIMMRWAAACRPEPLRVVRRQEWAHAATRRARLTA
jgi:hypothetical protein